MPHQGLAAQAQPQAPQPGNDQLPTVEEVVQLLRDGAAPEQLEDMGIPAELIMQAIQVLEQQMAQQGQAPQQGLAAQAQQGGI